MQHMAHIFTDPIFIAAAVTVLVVFVFIGLIVYGHKANVQTRALKSIDQHIVEGGMPADGSNDEDDTAEVTGPADISAEVSAEETMNAEDAACSFEEKAKIAADRLREKEELEEKRKREEYERRYSVGKSGKKYTREELEEIIKN
jgi:hypothetical protein